MTTYRLRAVALTLGVLAALTACSGNTSPETVADRFLRAFNAGDSAAACRYVDPAETGGDLDECEYAMDHYFTYWTEEDSWTVYDTSVHEDVARVTFDLAPSGSTFRVDLVRADGGWMVTDL